MFPWCKTIQRCYSHTDTRRCRHVGTTSEYTYHSEHHLYWYTNNQLLWGSPCNSGRQTDLAKGFDRLVDAWNIVQKRHPDWILDIFGEGFYKDSLTRQIKDRKLEHSITIHPLHKHNARIPEQFHSGPKLQLRRFWTGLDRSHESGCSLCFFRLSFRSIGNHQKPGRRTPRQNGDIQGFANALCHLIEHEAERKAFGKRAKQI